MKRREFLFAVPALAAARGVGAQQPGKIYRVGFILTTSPETEMQGAEPVHPAVRAFLSEMGRLGYVEGKNLVLERRSAEGRYERFDAIVAELLKRKLDALVTVSIPLTLAAKKQTSSVPIVFVIAGAGDPVAAGLVQSLARPGGGNITGFMADPEPAVFGKRIELLKEALPNVSRIAILGLAAERSSLETRNAEAAAKKFGLSHFFVEARVDDYSAAFEEIRRQRADAIVVGAHPSHYTHRAQIAEFAASNRLADMHAYLAGVESGGLISYSADNAAFVQPARYLDRIFKGARPGDLPVQQPTILILAVNLKAARARGLTISPKVLLRADRVIE